MRVNLRRSDWNKYISRRYAFSSISNTSKRSYIKGNEGENNPATHWIWELRGFGKVASSWEPKYKESGLTIDSPLKISSKDHQSLFGGFI